MKTTNLLLLGLFALLFSSCVGVKSQVDFNNNSNYHTKFKTAFVEVKDIKLGAFLIGLNDSLIANLKQNNVIVNSFTTDALSLNSEKEIQSQIKLLNPDVIILLERADTNIGRGRYTDFYDGGIYILTIKIPSEDRNVWKASVTTHNENTSYGRNRIIKETIQQIIGQLQTDQLL